MSLAVSLGKNRQFKRRKKAMKEIQTHGKNKQIFLVSDDDFNQVSVKKWYMRGKYPMAQIWISGKPHSLRLHSFLMGKREGFQIDHTDGNPLNNQRENLRFATHAQQQQNRGVLRTNKSGFKGVFKHKSSGKWLAVATRNKKAYYGVLRVKAEDAASDYQFISNELFGEFAR